MCVKPQLVVNVCGTRVNWHTVKKVDITWSLIIIIGFVQVKLAKRLGKKDVGQIDRQNENK